MPEHGEDSGELVAYRADRHAPSTTPVRGAVDRLGELWCSAGEAVVPRTRQFPMVRMPGPPDDSEEVIL